MIIDRLRALTVLVAVAAAVGLAAPAAADSGLCNSGRGASGPNGYVLTAGPKGTTSVPGAPFTLSTQVTVNGRPVSGFCVDVVQNAGPSTGWPRSAVTDAQGVASVTWTSTAEGIDSVTAEYRDNSGQVVGDTARHTWAKASPSPRPSVTRTPTPSPRPAPTPTSSPAPRPSSSPTPSPTVSPTASPSSSASPTTSPSPTPSGSPTSPAVTASPSPGPATIHLDSPSALPGGSASLSGGSCPPGSAVTFAVEGAPAGAATARPDGTFEGTVQLPDTSIGAHVIQAMCGGRTASAPIDLVVSSASSAPSGAGATVAAVFLFFLLLGSVLLTRNHGKQRAGEPD